MFKFKSGGKTGSNSHESGTVTTIATASKGTGATTSDDAGSSSLKSGSEITPENELLLYELETSDSGSIGLVLRAIYDGGDVHKFLRALEKKIRHYDRDIEKLCSYHYQGFIDAIRELLQLKTQCQELKEDVEVIDQHLAESSKSLHSKAKEIVRYRKLQRNIASAIDSISLCLPMLEKYSKLQEQIENKRYYPALKTLEQLEHTYLPHVERYRFAQKLMESVSNVRDQIKDESFSEFTDFLENVRKVSARIGEVALRHASEQHDLDSAESQKRRRRNRLIEAQKILSPSRNTPQKELDGREDSKFVNGPIEDTQSLLEEDEVSAQEMVDLGPVYRCCHIFSVLGARETFEAYYRKQRREQAGLVLKAPEKMQGTLESYLSYFHEVIGFFVIEEQIMNTAPGLVTRSYRDELWELAVQQVVKTLNTHFGNCTDPQVMLKIKKLIILFALTVKGYGFLVGAFYKLLQNFRDQYNEILMAECSQNFDQILISDNYTPITVNNKEEYSRILERFPFYQRGFDQENFPKKFPFSELVPNIYEQEKVYVRGCLRFMENVGLVQSEIDDTVRRYTNVLLERISGSLRSFAANKKLSLTQLVQITINIAFLEKACESLEQFIMKTSGSQSGGSTGHAVRLKEDAFRDARSEVEQRIEESLKEKVAEFLDLANYNWELNSCAGTPSDYISDLIRFLDSTFSSFTNLPAVLARHICMQACKYLARRMVEMLIDTRLRQISPGALEQFSLDVMQCESFAARCPLPGFEDGTLVMTFADLRQLLDLVQASDWSGYLADFGRDRSKYVRVQPQTAVILLEKMVEYERRRNSIFAKGSKENKDRKKLIETVIKQLKTLAAN